MGSGFLSFFLNAHGKTHMHACVIYSAVMYRRGFFPKNDVSDRRFLAGLEKTLIRLLIHSWGVDNIGQYRDLYCFKMETRR